MHHPHKHRVPDWASVTFDPSRVTLVRVFPVFAARAGERGATAAFVRRNTLPSIEAGLTAHSYSQMIDETKKKAARYTGVNHL